MLTGSNEIVQGNEHAHQCTLLNWFAAQYPTLRNYLFAIPNGAMLCDLPPHKRLSRMNYLISEGFKKGVSDLFLAVPAGPYHGLWLEMKAPGKTQSSLSDEQLNHITDMRRMGYQAHWASGFERAHDIISEYLALRG